MIRLQCGSQQYAWGKKGSNSVVAQLLQAAASDGQRGDHDAAAAGGIKEDQPYAELWMGTHPNCPSRVADPASSTSSSEDPQKMPLLASWLHRHADALGSAVVRSKESGEGEDGLAQLPFLFKVLSIEQALSIQAHPDRALGRILRANRPQHYPDDNHKPEMALAVEPCEVLCGFRTVQEIALLLRHAPELTQVVGQEHVDRFLADAGKKSDKEVVKPLFERLMRADPASVAQGVKALQSRVTDGRGSSEEAVRKTEELAVRLNAQFPGDVGCFVTYFLNHLHLVPGQAVFLGPNVPHAYIRGDMVECMASSDNTVRAGLTPKFKDVDTLVDMLTYKCGEPDWVFPTSIHDGVKIYSPPVEEFAVSSVHLSAGGASSAVLPPCDSFGLVLIYAGEAMVETLQGQETVARTRVRKGQVYGLAAGHGLKITSEGESVTLFRATANCSLVRRGAGATSKF